MDIFAEISSNYCANCAKFSQLFEIRLRVSSKSSDDVWYSHDKDPESHQ